MAALLFPVLGYIFPVQAVPIAPEPLPPPIAVCVVTDRADHTAFPWRLVAVFTGAAQDVIGRYVDFHPEVCAVTNAINRSEKNLFVFHIKGSGAFMRRSHSKNLFG